MAEPQTNSNSSNSNSSSTTVNTSVDYLEIINDNDDDECSKDEECCDQPKVIRLGKGDVIVVRLDRGDLTSAKYKALAEQTAAKFKAVFPTIHILVIPNSTSYTVVKQPEVHV
jgi:hypothetical protein